MSGASGSVAAGGSGVSDVDALHQRLQSVLRELDESRSQYERSRTSLVNCQQQADAAQGSWTTLQGKHAKVVKEKESLATELAVLTEAKVQVEQQLAALTTAVATLTAQNSGLSSQVAALTREMDREAEARDEWQVKFHSSQDGTVGVCVFCHPCTL